MILLFDTKFHPKNYLFEPGFCHTFINYPSSGSISSAFRLNHICLLLIFILPAFYGVNLFIPFNNTLERELKFYSSSVNRQFKFFQIEADENGKTYTYKELYESIIRCAGGLKNLGVKKGDVIAVALANRFEFPVIVVAAAICGAILTTCNPTYTVGKVTKLYILDFTFYAL